MFDFTEIIDRSGRDSIAADSAAAIAGGSLGPRDTVVLEGFDTIPMWVADMSFATASSVTRALRERIEHPCFGYYEPSDQYYQSIAWWHESQKGMPGVSAEYVAYENGVLGGLINALGVLCSPGDGVLVHAPTYTGFTNTLGNAGYKLVSSPLVRDADGVWRMDYEDMEHKVRCGGIHAVILCSPHNPTGRVWERWELERAMDLFARYDVRVVSDEIWSDIILDGNRHIPTQMVSEDARNRTVALYAPSKTFNLAGLVGSYRVVYDPWLRDRLARQSGLSHYNSQPVAEGPLGATVRPVSQQQPKRSLHARPCGCIQSGGRRLATRAQGGFKRECAHRPRRFRCDPGRRMLSPPGHVQAVRRLLLMVRRPWPAYR